MHSNAKTNYTLPKLPYSLDALEPVLSKEAMQLHYEKHHQGYVTKLNEALDQYHMAQKKNDVVAIVDLQKAIQFNGGGHINHSLYWTCLGPKNKVKKGPGKELEKVFLEEFENIDNFKKIFNQIAVGIQGSGWAFLGYDKHINKLVIKTTQNHGTITEMKLYPLLIIDVWEHAYYLQYQNRRANFLEAIWDIVNWEVVDRRFSQIMI